MTETLPDLTGWEPTRDTLHRYAQVLGAVRKALAEPHPLWWHISLQAVPEGLSTGPLPARGGRGEADQGGSFSLLLDLRAHRLRASGPAGAERSLPLDGGLTAADFARRALDLLAELGVEAPVDTSRVADDGPRAYDRAKAEGYLSALTWVAARFAEARREMAGDLGPVQLWPHHFDLAFEWFGDRRVADEGEDGEPTESRAQIGFGFGPGDESHAAPYLYANPWPFEAEFTIAPLPPGAEWHTEGWEGGLMPYDAARRGGAPAVRRFLQTVYDTAAPALRD